MTQQKQPLLQNLYLQYDDLYIQIIYNGCDDQLLFIYNNKYDDEASKLPDIRILSTAPFDPTTTVLIDTIADLLKDKKAPTDLIIESFKESILYYEAENAESEE